MGREFCKKCEEQWPMYSLEYCWDCVTKEDLQDILKNMANKIEILEFTLHDKITENQELIRQLGK